MRRARFDRALYREVHAKRGVNLAELRRDRLTLVDAVAPWLHRGRRLGVAVLAGLGVLALATPTLFWSANPPPANEAARRHSAYLGAAEFAHVAFPQWAHDHAPFPCPPSFTALRHYAPDTSVFDPWGGVFEMQCDDHGIVVRSPGPDGTFETDDDIIERTPR